MRRSLVTRLVGVVAVLALCSATAALAAQKTRANSRTPQLAGIWVGSYGGAVSGTFSLHWTQTGTKLTGTINLSRPKGSYGITGSVHQGGGISFGALSVGATYTGSVSNHSKSMSGRWTSAQGGGSWSAHKLATR
jgi:hypothetical protein